MKVFAARMIYDVNSPLFRSFLSQKGGGYSDKRYFSLYAYMCMYVYSVSVSVFIMWFCLWLVVVVS